MTVTLEILTDAYRQADLIPIGLNPTAEQQTEALRYLNRVVQGVFGNEVGDPLEAFPIGRDHINRPSGYPWWDDVPDNEWFVPKNTRLMFNLDRSIDIYLHPDPDDGTRFAVKDVSKTFGDHPVTFHGNGRLIGDDFTVTFDEPGYDAEYFYRADLGAWMKCTPLTRDDPFPLPSEFDDYFITQVAMRVNPSYEIALSGESAQVYKEVLRKLRARYSQNVPQRSELALIRPARLAADRDQWGSTYHLYNPTSMFNKGWPY